MIYNESSWEGLIPFVEERLGISRRPGSSFVPVPEMIGVFGMYSDNVVREVIDHVRTPCTYIGHVEISINDVYSHIASALYNHYNKNSYYLGRTNIDTRRTFLEKVSMVNRVAIMGVSAESVDLLQASTDRQRMDEYLREAAKIYKNLWSMPEEAKLLFWLDFGAEPIEYKTLKKLYNIQSPDIVIIVSSLYKIDTNVEFISAECNGSGRMLLNKVVPYLFEYNEPVATETSSSTGCESACRNEARPSARYESTPRNEARPFGGYESAPRNGARPFGGYESTPRNEVSLSSGDEFMTRADENRSNKFENVSNSDYHNTPQQNVGNGDNFHSNHDTSEDGGIPRNIIRRRRI